MSPAARRSGASGRPVVAVLTGHWGSKTEEGWLTRQVAGALACVADVHVICPEGRRASTSQDGVFTLHRLGTPLERTAELRRDLIVEALAAAGPTDRATVPAGVGKALDDGLIEPWRGASEVLSQLSPDLAVAVGQRNLGALAAIDDRAPELPVVLLALALPGTVGASPHFDRMIDRARQVLAVTETERQEIVDRHGRPESVHRIGAPLTANASVLAEPNTWVGDTGYVFIHTGVASDDDHVEAELSRIVRLRFDDRPVGVAHTDGFFVWHEGRRQRGWAIERSSDLARLMAWARVTVDLHPGRLFARTCVESLLYGTAIVVPADSRAREYAQRGRGGLWFGDAAELTWCVESLLETSAGDVLGAQGQAYAEYEFGSTDRFIDRVTGLCGLTATIDESPADRLPTPA
ncbi:MAG: hypothetical protein ABSF84_02595 [Acidimicrobiales bacterium]|jgi:hypothetical protein